MIIFTHHTGEPHGILGAQVAATFYQRKLSIPSVVIGIERSFSKEKLLHFIDEYHEGGERSAAQGEPRAPLPEPFDRLKTLSSVEGLGPKASLGL